MSDAETTGQISGADSDLTERVIGCACRVSNGLGIGFLFGKPRVEVKRVSL